MNSASPGVWADTVRVGWIPFAVSNLDDATEFVLSCIHARRGISVRLSNAYCVALASRDSKYRMLFSQNGVTFPDGTPVAWVMRRIAGSARTVRGPALFERTIDRGRNTSVRHFFLGASDDTLVELRRELEARYPGMKTAGWYAPPFGPVDDSLIDDIVDRVSRAESDVLWVALGTPKQDFATAELSARLRIPCLGVGAAFDFVAGTVQEAPKWLQGSGLEWVFRLASEPRRLWKRYLFGNTRFLISTLLDSKREMYSIQSAEARKDGS